MTVPGSLLPETFPPLFPFDVPMTELSISSETSSNSKTIYWDQSRNEDINLHTPNEILVNEHCVILTTVLRLHRHY